MHQACELVILFQKQDALLQAMDFIFHGFIICVHKSPSGTACQVSCFIIEKMPSQGGLKGPDRTALRSK